jgi:hypothetical protein
MFWLWRVDLWVFLQSNVSYPKIFNLDQNHLTQREIWKVGNFFAFIYEKKHFSMLNARCFSWLELSVSGSPNYIGNQTNCWSCVNMVWWCLFLLAYYNSENNGYGLVITTISWFPSILTSFSLVFRLWNIRLQSLLFFFQHLNITSSLRNGQTFIAHCGFSQVSIIHSIHITGI